MRASARSRTPSRRASICASSWYWRRSSWSATFKVSATGGIAHPSLRFGFPHPRRGAPVALVVKRAFSADLHRYRFYTTSWDSNASREDSGLPPCEFRQQEGSGELVCLAAGGRSLAKMAGPGRTPADVCRSCPVPGELARRPCLYQVPIKVRRDGEWAHYFPCRFFWPLQARSSFPCTTLDWCIGCPYWFPRPETWPDPDEYLRRTRQMADEYLREVERPPAPPPPPWKRILARVTAWIR